MYLKVPYTVMALESADQGEKSEIVLKRRSPANPPIKSFDGLLLIRFTDNFTDIFTDFSFHFPFWSSKLINVKVKK